MKEENTYYEGMNSLNLSESLRVNPFVVPESYFSRSREEIQLRLKMESYKVIEKRIWKVPPKYFEELSAKILAQTKLAAVSKEVQPDDVPQGYFEDLSARIQTKIFEEKLKRQVSDSGFIVPDGYTEVLKDKIIAQTSGKETRKAPVRKLRFSRWMAYAAAACISVFVGVALYNTTNDRTAVSADASQLAAIPEDEIINYLSAMNEGDDMLYIMECIDHNHDSEGVCTHVEENDIEDYLNYAL